MASSTQRPTGPSTSGIVRSLSRRRSTVGWLVAALLLAAGIPALGVAARGLAAGAARDIGHAELPLSAALQVAPTDFLAADAARTSIKVYDSPNAPQASKTLSNPTREGVPLVFSVLAEQGDWLQVRLPMRPNGSTGWVRAQDVRLRKVANRIVVDKSEHRLRAYRGEEVLLDVPAGVGTSSTPTPVGEFYVDISIPFANSSGAYGAHMLSIAGFSEVHFNFGGGIGQLAIHGTNNRGSVGVNSSNGCIRLFNESILRLKELAPTGTPVSVQA
jgi:lipoprotein-anchoring transpeptidase ErfK/SrfK